VNPAIHLPPKGLYEFGPFCLDCARHLLLKDGHSMPLPPKAFEILVILIQRRGTLLTKTELLHAVWPDTFVEENNLTQYVSMLRKTLSDGSDDQKYIQTVPKLGYRFTAEVHEIAEGGPDLLVAKHTRTRIVLREEEEEEVQEDSGPAVSTSAKSSDVSITAQEGATRAGKNQQAWKWVAAFGALGLTVLGALVVFHDFQPRPGESRAAVSISSPVKPRQSIAVLGFKNLSGRPGDDWLSTALSEMLSTELSSGGQLRVVSGEEIKQMKSDLQLAGLESLSGPTLSQIRSHIGADLTVSGGYVELKRDTGSQIRLDLRLQDTASGETILSFAETGTPEDLFALVLGSGAQLRAKLGVPPPSSLELAQSQAALPSTPEAARLYSQGLSRLRASDAPTAQKFLSKTVSIDPNFALGHSALATAWSALGYDEKAKNESRRALELSSNLSRPDHLMIAGQYNELTRDWDQAVDTYQQLFRLYPDSLDYGLRLANAQTSAGKGHDALSTLAILRKLPPPSSDDPDIDLAQAVAAESLGDFKQELEASNRAIREGESFSERLLVARSWVKKGWALRRLGQPAEAITGLLEAKKLFAEAGDIQGVASTLHIIAGVQSEQGNYVQATQSYQEAIKIFRRIGDRRALALSINGLGVVEYEQSNYQGAKALYEQYLEIEREVGSKINTAGALGNIANVADAQGELAEARKLNEESIKIFFDVGDQRALGTALGNLAILLYEQGDLEAARKKFGEALEIKRKIGYQRGIAYDLAGLGEVLRAEGDLAAAREKQEESVAIRNQLGEKHNAEANRLYLAILDLEEGNASEGLRSASDIARAFHEEKSAADEAAALEVEARSLLLLGRLSEAQAAIDRARTLARPTSSLPLNFDIAITSARILAARAGPQRATSAAKATENLESSLSLARKCGYLEYEYKFELALGEIEIQSGNLYQGRTRLEALARDATARGFNLIARHAAKWLTRESARRSYGPGILAANFPRLGGEARAFQSLAKGI
jgi:eukaryotic-like serine/threonine-protein kinase